MAKATATCTCKRCGKEFVASATKRNLREAESWSAWAVNNIDLCPDCYKADKIDAKNDDIIDFLCEELPALEGSPKQIKWAEQIRTKAAYTIIRWINNMHRYRNNYDSQQLYALSVTVDCAIDTIKCTNASWWIDNRNSAFCKLVGDRARNIFASRVQPEPATTEASAEPNEETAEMDTASAEPITIKQLYTCNSPTHDIVEMPDGTLYKLGLAPGYRRITMDDLTPLPNIMADKTIPSEHLNTLILGAYHADPYTGALEAIQMRYFGLTKQTE